MKITFLGGTGTVTGSKYLVESGRARILVDCGLFQGVKDFRLRNWAELPFEVSSLDAVVLTHAHLDHSGMIPRLVESGFSGRIHCTAGTRDLCSVLLPDSGHLQEEEARYANKRGFSKHSPALPLYTEMEARKSLRSFRTHNFHEDFQPAKGLRCRFTPAGHILGSACVSLSNESTTLTFSGDVGRPVNSVLKPPQPLGKTDYLVVESTYGNRLHPSEDSDAELAEIVINTWKRGGTVLIPSFAVGRAQMVLHMLSELRDQKKIPNHPLFMDSPMAIDATEIYASRHDELLLSREEAHEMCSAARFMQTQEQSMSLSAMEGPLLIISASGMCTGGRVLHHLKRLLPNPANTVLFVGFQAAGTRGEALVNGVNEIKVHGQYVPVKAEIRMLDALSAHGDRAELLEWLGKTPGAPIRTFVTHGEAAASDAFRRYLSDTLNWTAVVPKDGETVTLN